jgi:hypothetical protein
LEEFFNVDAGAMKMQETLNEHRDGYNATKKDEPHERSTLLHVVDHPGLIRKPEAERNTYGLPALKGRWRRFEGWVLLVEFV